MRALLPLALLLVACGGSDPDTGLSGAAEGTPGGAGAAQAGAAGQAGTGGVSGAGGAGGKATGLKVTGDACDAWDVWPDVLAVPQLDMAPSSTCATLCPHRPAAVYIGPSGGLPPAFDDCARVPGASIACCPRTCWPEQEKYAKHTCGQSAADFKVWRCSSIDAVYDFGKGQADPKKRCGSTFETAIGIKDGETWMCCPNSLTP